MQNLLISLRGEERMGYYYLSHWETDKIYDYNYGLSEKKEAAIIL